MVLPSRYVYILKSNIRDWVYVGSTDDLDRRMNEHEAGLVQSTKAYRPLTIVAYVAVATEKKARDLKSISRQAQVRRS